jgi:hypothetical protein
MQQIYDINLFLRQQKSKKNYLKKMKDIFKKTFNFVASFFRRYLSILLI